MEKLKEQISEVQHRDDRDASRVRKAWGKPKLVRLAGRDTNFTGGSVNDEFIMS